MTDTQTTEAGEITGTLDKDYNLLWYTETCLENALRLEKYRDDAERAEDSELAELFSKAQSDSRKGAEIGMRMLADRLTGMAPPASAATMESDGGSESGSESAQGETEESESPEMSAEESEDESEGSEAEESETSGSRS